MIIEYNKKDSTLREAQIKKLYEVAEKLPTWEEHFSKVIPVINMRTRFNMSALERDSDTRIVVMEFDQKIVGFLVDGVSEVLRIPASTVEPAPPVVCGIGSEYIRGVGKLEDRLLILLDLDTLLSDMNADAG